MIKNNRNNEQIYGRNDMIMLDPNNKIYGSLGLADNYVMKTEEGTKLALSNPKLGSFADVLTEFNIYGHSEQESTTGANLIDVDSMLNECLVKNADDTYSILKTETNRFSKSFPVNLKAGTKVSFNADVIEYNGVYNLKLQVNTGYGTISVGRTLTLKSDITDVTIYQDGNNDVGTYTKFKNAILSVGEAKVPYEPYTGGKPSPSPDYPQEIKSVVSPTVKVTNEDGLKVQSVTLNNITLNAIPVSSGGNVTVGGQQWVCDEVDLERGVKVQRVGKVEMSDTVYRGFLSMNPWDTHGLDKVQPFRFKSIRTVSKSMIICTALPGIVEGEAWGKMYECIGYVGKTDSYIDFYIANERLGTTAETTADDASKALMKWLETNPFSFIYALTTPIETPLTPAEIAAFNAFTTYYPVTIVENNYNTWMKATYKSTESV